MEYVFEQGFCDEATRDKDWIEYGLLLSTGEESLEEFERVKDCVAACTASKTKAELLEVAMERRLLLAPMTTIADVVGSEQFAEREYFMTPEGEGEAASIRYPGPFAKFSKDPLFVLLNFQYSLEANSLCAFLNLNPFLIELLLFHLKIFFQS